MNRVVQCSCRLLGPHRPTLLQKWFSRKLSNLKECYGMFYLEEDCSIEELQAAYERQVRRNSNDLSLVKEIDKAYHKIYEEKIALKHAEQPKDSTDGNIRRYVASKYKSSVGIEKFVDSLVEKDMKHFDITENPGYGKPIPKKYNNPFVDSLEGKLNQIMINNNVASDWIQLKKEIREELANAKYVLTEYYKRYYTSKSKKDKTEFEKAEIRFNEAMKDINKKIEDYNLIIPSPFLTMVPYDPVRLYNRLTLEVEKKLNIQSDESNNKP